ncbi:hypothetical protein ACQW02_11110 [Humitalea sp. 24SJ18S-53]|uniref:hypothetical protein n=1 Tax=Humitalea sp. 24SJ18S-53 TaxID=3422307 RepID=UPI003D675AB9
MIATFATRVLPPAPPPPVIEDETCPWREDAPRDSAARVVVATLAALAALVLLGVFGAA